MSNQMILSSLVIIKDSGDFELNNFVKIEFNEFKNENLINCENKSFKLTTGHEYYKENSSMKIFCQSASLMMKFKTSEDFSKFLNWVEASIRATDQTNEDKKKEIKALISESFTTGLIENSNLGFNSGRFLAEQIKNYLKVYNKNVYYGPFAIVCQSSGFGKSRACFGLVDEGFYVVYCCLRSDKSSGYPKRSETADILLKQKNAVKHFKSYFKAFIDILNQKEYGCLEFFELYGKQDGSLNKKLINSINEYLNLDEEINIPMYLKENTLVFVFDEATSLFPENYFVLRSLLSNLHKNIFVLFLDTYSHLTDFMPISTHDPSKRISEKQLMFFDPIYLLPNWDVFLEGNYNRIQNIQDSILFENICMFGRPLWGSWMHTKLNSNRNQYQLVEKDDLLSLAIEKLIGDKNLKENLNDNDCLAILSSRVGTIKPKQITTSQNLVAMNMAICIYLDIQKNLFEIEYPSEPILALASAILMEQKFSFIMKNIIQQIETNLISIGEKGELIAKLILIIAIDKAFKNSGYSKLDFVYLNYVKVGCFIQTLFGKCSENCGNDLNNWVCSSSKIKCSIKIICSQIQNPSILLNGFVNFNHFTKAESSMERISLLDSLKRNAAVHCVKNQKAIDFVIPVSLNENDFNSITAIMVQVKLNEAPSVPNHVLAFHGINSKLFYDLNKNLPYLLLFMQLGGDQNFIKDIKGNLSLKGNEHKKQTVIYSQGISKKIFPILNDDSEMLLKSYSLASHKLFNLNDPLELEKEKIYRITRFSLRKK